MTQTRTPFDTDPSTSRPEGPRISGSEVKSYLDWSAVIGGAVVATGMSLLLLGFGAAIGLSMISPWAGESASPATLGWSAAIWFALVQVFSYGIGAYLTGRMRPRVGDATTDEVSFRDAVHGLCLWGLGITVSVMLVAAATASAARTGAQAAAPALSAASVPDTPSPATLAGAPPRGALDPFAYTVDMMLRTPRPDQRPPDDVRNEVTRILANAVTQGGTLPQADRDYLVSLVAARTAVSQQDAELRVNQAAERVKGIADTARQAADNARNSVAFSGFWVTFVLLLSGLVTVWTAALGGQHRDMGLWYRRGDTNPMTERGAPR